MQIVQVQDICPVFSEYAHKPDRINDRTETVQSCNTTEQIVQLSAEVCTVICVHRNIRLVPVQLTRRIRPNIRTVFSKLLGYAQHNPTGAPAPCHIYLCYIHEQPFSVSHINGAKIQKTEIVDEENIGFDNDTNKNTNVEAFNTDLEFSDL